MSLLESRSYYKPFQYPWAYDLWKKHEAIHWFADEVQTFDSDIRDWNHKLTEEEKNLLTQLFRFFTQADIDVADGYTKIYLPRLSNHPELTMMMAGFAAREAVHIDAYSKLIETVGMPEATYKAFSEYQEMEAKHEFVERFDFDTDEGLLKSLAVYSGFTEGMQLFSSFAILMNFSRNNKMKAMSNIVRWSLRDETIHVEGMTKLFRELRGELQVNDLHIEIEKIAGEMVELEDQFIDLCFAQGGTEGLTPEEVKEYIRFIANKRWTQLGFSGSLYDVNKNPLPWLDWVINGSEHSNFFEDNPTEYSKGMIKEAKVEW